MKFQCPITGLSWDCSHWVINESGSRDDRTLLKHYRSKLPHPIFQLKKQELWKLTDDRAWSNHSLTEQRLVATAYLHATGCITSNLPWMPDAQDIVQYWNRLRTECEWLHKIHHQSIGIPVPKYHIQDFAGIRRICTGWLQSVEQIHIDFLNGVSYKDFLLADEARAMAARRKMAKQMLHTPDRRTIPPTVVKFVLDELAPRETMPEVRRVWMYFMMWPESQLMAAVGQKAVKVADLEELIESLETWQLDSGTRYQVLRIMRSKYQFLVDSFDLVADNENMVSKFLSSKSIKPGQYQVLKPSLRDTAADELIEMLSSVGDGVDDNPQVEASTRNRLAEIAPDKEPRLADFTDKVNFLKQKALWNLKQRQKMQQEAAKKLNGTGIHTEEDEDDNETEQGTGDSDSTPVFERGQELPILFERHDEEQNVKGDNDEFSI